VGSGAGAGTERLPPGFGQTNNTTRHEDPDSVSEEGDASRVAAWLAGRLGDQLRGSTLQLSRGEYELADRFVTEGFGNYLGRYVDVAGETDSTDDDEAAEAFRDVRADQRQLVNRTGEYERTLREYRRAQEAGNASRARRLARELQSLAEGVNRSALDVSRGAAAIENRTDVSLAETRARLATLRREVLSRQANITASLFVGTRLTASTNRTRAAFDRPVRVSGRLTADGSLDPPDRATLQFGEVTRRVRVDDRGRFAFTYRPTLVSTGRQTVTLRYIPDPSAPYLEAEAALDLDIDQVPSSVNVTTAPDAVRFAEGVRVAGSVSAGGRPVPGVPVLVRAGDRRLGTVTTARNGSYTFAGRVPADVPDGQRRVTAAVAVAGRAVGQSNASTGLLVNGTDTALTAEAVRVDGPVRVRGRLQTVDGTPVPDQPVRLDPPGSATVTARTDANGTYTARLARSTADPVDITVRFSGRGTNLNASSTRLRVPARNDTAGDGPDTSPGASDDQNGDEPGSDSGSLPLALAGLLALVAVLGATAVVALRRGTGGEAGPAAATGGSGGDDGDGASPAGTARTDPVTLVEAAVADGEYDRASRELYALVRASLADRAGTDGGTHWEFYDAVASVPDTDAEDREALRTVTETYERAAFAPTPVGERRARTTLAAGKRLLEAEAP